MLSPGIVLQQRYRIKRLLARGGMGAVYEAEAVHLRNATVAVKETFFNEDRKSLREQFEREAATLARLRHPALPQVKDHFIEGGGQFLVMDFIEGADLGALLERRLKGRGEPFGFPQALEWADRLLDALDYIHGQYPPVIHRDIKPQNLKLTPRGELFLIDFGLAKDATTPTRPGHSIHAYTLEFAPPEQIKGAGTDARSDLYSLGATLHHLVTGKLPPDARIREETVAKYMMPDPLEPAHRANPLIPFAFAAVLAKAMALDREQRYQSAREMRDALREIKQSIEAEIAERERRESERRRLEEEERKRREEEDRRREEDRKKWEEEDRRHEIDRQRQIEEAARLQALQEELRKKEEELEKLKRELPHKAVTKPVSNRPVARERRIDQEEVAREADASALAERREKRRGALDAILVSVLIVSAYLLRDYFEKSALGPWVMSTYVSWMAIGLIVLITRPLWMAIGLIVLIPRLFRNFTKSMNDEAALPPSAEAMRYWLELENDAGNRVSGLDPLPPGERFQLHFKPSEGGYLYLTARGRGRAWITFVTKQWIDAGSDFQFPGGDNWINVGKGAIFTVIFSPELLNEPSFLNEDGRRLTFKEEFAQGFFKGRWSKSTSPETNASDDGAIVTARKRSDEPLVFDIDVVRGR